MKTNFSKFAYTLMRKFADNHNNTHDYTLLHSKSWLIGLVLMMLVAVLAWNADFEVLFGIEFNSTEDYNRAWWKALLLASVIQILILVNGGMAIKIGINGLLENREHKIQFVLHSILFAAGFAATIYLSTQTYQSAKARSHALVQANESEIDKEKTNLSSQYQSELDAINQKYETSKANLEKLYQAKIQNAKATWLARLEEKRIYYQQGRLNKNQLNRYEKRYQRKMEQVSQPLNEALQNSLLKLLEQRQTAISDLEQSEKQAVVQTETVYKETAQTLAQDIEVYALSTRYKNVILNIISFLLCVGTLFFARGANEGKRPQANPNPKKKRVEEPKREEEQPEEIPTHETETTIESALDIQSRTYQQARKEALKHGVFDWRYAQQRANQCHHRSLNNATADSRTRNQYLAKAFVRLLEEQGFLVSLNEEAQRYVFEQAKVKLSVS